MTAAADELALDEYFRSDVDPADVVGLTALLRGRPALSAMQALFNGSEPALMIRLLVLREIGNRGAQPFWTAAELRGCFPYLDEAKLDNVLLRLRTHGLLIWDTETSRYALSAFGQMAIAAVTGMLGFAGEDDELGYIAGQLAGSSAVGRVGSEELQHLLSRLLTLKDEFDRAILSASENRIREAERKLRAVWQWVDRGSDILRSITETADLDSSAHRVAQRIGQVQSELLRMSGAFQRALNKIEAQRVHLGASGLSSSDVSSWLRGLNQIDIAALADDAVSSMPEFAFVLGDIALDVAEYELVDKLKPERIDVPLPPPEAAPGVDEVAMEAPDWGELDRLRGQLLTAADGLAISDAVPLRDYALSSYRLSLLALLGDRESAGLTGPVAELARLPQRLEIGPGIVEVNRDGVANMSEGALRISETRGSALGS